MCHARPEKHRGQFYVLLQVEKMGLFDTQHRELTPVLGVLTHGRATRTTHDTGNCPLCWRALA